MGCCGTKEEVEEPQTERTRLLQDVLAPDHSSLNSPSRQPIPFSGAGSPRAPVFDIESKLFDVVTKTENGLITIGDAGFTEELSPSTVADLQRKYGEIVRHAACTGLDPLPQSSPMNTDAGVVLMGSAVSDADRAMVMDVADQVATAVRSMRVNPVDGPVVIDFSALETASR